ncbi:MAG TPA: hypothetical protein VN969_28175 [Streptosporangiaceae bacterium]|nr:hypothetical protein [Streptosporangiaceae bacterium]
MRARLTLTGIATAGLLAAGLSIGTPAAYAASIPADCTLSISGTTASLTCTQRPQTQVWNLLITCHITDGDFNLAEPGNEVTGDGTSTLSGCYDPHSAAFIIDS